ETDRGLDTILAFETNDGADVFENDDLANGYVDSRLVLPLETSGRVRVIVDHHRALALDGDDDPFEVRMTIDQPASNEELEPNDLRELASTLVFPGETAAGIGPVRNGAPDVDWYRVTANAGQIVSFRVLIPPASQIDPAMAIGKAGTEEFEPMYLNYDSSGISSRIDVIFPEAGAYDLIVIDQNNVEEPFHGGPLFTYRVFGEVTGIQPISILTSTGALSGTLDPGGRILRHVVAPREASLVAIEGTAGSRDFDPMVRVYGPSAVGLLGEGLYGAFAYLPAAGSYVVGVSNGNDGSGSTEHTYDLTATLYPLTASAEAEPNDTSMEATPIELTPANVITGELAAVTDLDRVRVTLAAGSTLDALLSIGGRGRTVSVYAAGDPMPLDSAAFGVYGVAIPADGDYEVEVSGTTAGPYTLGLRVR
ncbi:hypothetical protein L6R52_42595, partial [Myxococcota bacterium]|nr:hypothetical protein [Myxococcota bacterium]